MGQCQTDEAKKRDGHTHQGRSYNRHEEAAGQRTSRASRQRSDEPRLEETWTQDEEQVSPPVRGKCNGQDETNHCERQNGNGQHWT